MAAIVKLSGPARNLLTYLAETSYLGGRIVYVSNDRDELKRRDTVRGSVLDGLVRGKLVRETDLAARNGSAGVSYALTSRGRDLTYAIKVEDTAAALKAPEIIVLTAAALGVSVSRYVGTETTRRACVSLRGKGLLTADKFATTTTGKNVLACAGKLAV
jgi:hypothetical protein